MRFKFKPAEKEQEGDVRTIKKFLFLPKWINDEVRWLEVAYIEQAKKTGSRLQCGHDQYDMQMNHYFYWLDIAFVGEPKEGE